jgi:hypothetical protein
LNNKTPNIASTNIIIAIIGFVGTVFVAIMGYLGVQYQVDQPIKLTEKATTPSTSSHDASNFDLSTSWAACSSSIAKVIPENISPETNSYNTLTQLPDYEIWNVAPLDSTFPAILSVQNTATDGNWIRINKYINIRFQLTSPNIPNHVNLFYASEGCGDGNYKTFTPVLLTQNNDMKDQVIISIDYDFFTL